VQGGAGGLRGPAYRLVTPRLVLRCWQPLDAAAVSQAIESSLDQLSPWLPWPEEPRSFDERVDQLREQRAKLDLGQSFQYGVFAPDGARVLGGVSLFPRVGPAALELGYWLRSDAVGQGLASEASAALVRIAFELHQVSRVEIHCDPNNARSVAVPRRLGFRHEATLARRYLDVAGALTDTMLWTLFDDDYPASPVAASPLEAFDAVDRRLL
jgi:RimJ/RimL family protein N-acetyltransferase